jgi:tRNAThr (cytosine32-N3)-methyltransferase
MASSGITLEAPPALEAEKLAADISTLGIQDENKPAAGATEQLPPHRSHDPQYNQKRSDPFQFGSRFLNQDDDVFEFNAWDHVEVDDAFKEFAEKQYAMHREHPVSDFDKREFLPP